MTIRILHKIEFCGQISYLRSIMRDNTHIYIYRQYLDEFNLYHYVSVLNNLGMEN